MYMYSLCRVVQIVNSLYNKTNLKLLTVGRPQFKTHKINNNKINELY